MIMMDGKQLTKLVFVGTNGSSVEKTLSESGTIPTPTASDTKTFTENGTVTIDVTNLKTLTIITNVQREDPKTVVSITATYVGSDLVEGTPISEITDVTVVARYDDETEGFVSGWTISGASDTIQLGENTLTVSYGGCSDNIIVTGVEAPAGVGWRYAKEGLYSGFDDAIVEVNGYGKQHGITAPFTFGKLELDMAIPSHDALNANATIMRVTHGNGTVWYGFNKTYSATQNGIIMTTGNLNSTARQTITLEPDPNGQYSTWTEASCTKLGFGWRTDKWNHVFYGAKVYDAAGNLIFQVAPTSTIGTLHSVLDDTNISVHTASTDGITLVEE